jgi:hypothetical protein
MYIHPYMHTKLDQLYTIGYWGGQQDPQMELPCLEPAAAGTGVVGGVGGAVPTGAPTASTGAAAQPASAARASVGGGEEEHGGGRGGAAMGAQVRRLTG